MEGKGNDMMSCLVNKKYTTDYKWAADPAVLREIVSFTRKMKPSQESLDITFELIKFYRFPITICFSHLYHRLKDTRAHGLEPLKPKILEIAAYVKSLLKACELETFPEIAFFFEWGRAKKKFNIKCGLQEVKFGQFVVELSHRHKEIQTMIGQKMSKTEQQLKINQFLTSTYGKSMNVFEDNYHSEMVRRASSAIDMVEQEEETPEPNKDFPSLLSNPAPMPKQSAPKVVNTSKVNNTRADNVPLYHKTFFINEQVIEQPQSLRVEYKHYTYPFKNRNQGSKPVDKQQIIKKTMCGFLNAEGGIIYFGIKEDTITRKRRAIGHFFNERKKKDFTYTIEKLFKDILPQVGKNPVRILWVPVKSKAKDTYIRGQYVAKVMIERGAKDQLYSYEIQSNMAHHKIEKFAFKTENEVLIRSDAQQLLKMFKNKLEQPERTHYGVESEPCKPPELGIPVYGSDSESEQESEREEKEVKEKEESLVRDKPNTTMEEYSWMADKQDLGGKSDFISKEEDEEDTWGAQERKKHGIMTKPSR